MRKGEIACNKQFLHFSQCFLPCMAHIFHFKCTLKCRLPFVSIWTSLNFVIWKLVNVSKCADTVFTVMRFSGKKEDFEHAVFAASQFHLKLSLRVLIEWSFPYSKVTD